MSNTRIIIIIIIFFSNTRIIETGAVFLLGWDPDEQGLVFPLPGTVNTVAVFTDMYVVTALL